RNLAGKKPRRNSEIIHKITIASTFTYNKIWANISLPSKKLPIDNAPVAITNAKYPGKKLSRFSFINRNIFYLLSDKNKKMITTLSTLPNKSFKKQVILQLYAHQIINQ